MSVQPDPNYSFVLNATEAPPLIRDYDYIIIGGGTAGCPLAATLSQNYSVLLLERGGQPYQNAFVENLVGFYPNLQIDTSTSASQSFTSEEGIPNQRARVLGGGSAINAGFFTYADPDFVAEAGWNVALVNDSFTWVADEIAEIPTLQTFQSAAQDALLEVGVTPYNGETYEHLIGTKVGGSIFDSYGRRHTAADLLTYANPSNLDVYIWASAQRLIFAPEFGANSQWEPRAIGVIYVDLDGNNHTALLSENPGSEIILSAGALGTPVLLMLSGIGPADHLAAFNITTILDNPAVGSNMADNPTNSMWVLTNQAVEVSLIQVVGITSWGSFIEISSGQAEVLIAATERDSVADNPTSIGSRSSWGRSDLNYDTFTAQSSLTRIFSAIREVPGPFRLQASWSGTILQKIWGPLSSGLLRLSSLNAIDNPRVWFNYFQDPQDLATCEQGIRTVLDMLNSPSLSRLQYTIDTIPRVLRPVREAVESSRPQRDLSNATQDSINIRQWCVDTVTTIWHYHGGSLVGDVVGQDYRVIGVQSLRVIDGSTFRRSPGSNPQATVMMLGRYMGVQILRERLGTEAGV